MSALASIPESLISAATANDIKAKAAAQVTTVPVRIWIQWDEQGAWEARAKDLYIRLQDDGMQDVPAREAAATLIAYEAVIAYAHHLGMVPDVSA